MQIAYVKVQFHWFIFISLADDCQITCLLSCSDQICIGTTEGTVVILSAENGRLLQKFSLHANQVRVLLELPQITKPCICAELPIKTEYSLKQTVSHGEMPMQDKSFILPKRATSTRDKHKMSMKLNTNSHPLFASIGDGLANWFGNGNETTQSLEFLTWTDDFV